LNGVRVPAGFGFERLRRDHPRKSFRSGQEQVDDWLASKALQNQEKRLSVTKLLIERSGEIAGYYTLATGQVDFGDLPLEITKRLPRRMLPVVVLAWLGVALRHHGRGLGRLVLSQALVDCHTAGQTLAFVAVVTDCIDDRAKAFYSHWDFKELPGWPYRLFLSAKHLEAMVLDKG
jgi:GNAT superfamily N-acetyltransferase